MPRKGADERASNYALKLDPEHIKQILERRKSAMVGKQGYKAGNLAEIEDLVKATLADEADVTITEYPYYYDFARQVYRLHSRLPGGTAHDKEIRILVDTWTARKLSEATLLKIVKEVFGATIA
jgi:hypothetical protein